MVKLLVALLFYSIDCFAQIKLPAERESLSSLYPFEKMNGKVRSMHIMHYRFVRDSILNTWKIPQRFEKLTGYKYDILGNKIAKVQNDESGRLIETENMLYDESSRLLKVIDVRNNETIDSVFYDEALRRITRTKTNDLSSKKKIEYFFDNKGRLIREEHYGIEDSVLNVLFSYNYDSSGRLIREQMENTGNIGMTINFNGSSSKMVFPGYLFSFVYKENEIMTYSSKSELDKDSFRLKEESIFYKKGNRKVSKTYFQGKLSHTDSLVENNDGYMLFRKSSMSIRDDYTVSSFDKNGRLLNTFREQNSSLLSHHTYVFDSQGNVLESSYWDKDGKLIGFEKRLFEYY